MSKTKFANQICSECGRIFIVRYNENGTYDYVTEPCECEALFSPANGYPSISEWLQEITQCE